jgi:hypothetical protein
MKSRFAAPILVLILASSAQAQDSAPKNDERPYPVLVTDATRADAKALAELQMPGTILFHDEFESADSLKNYFEIRGEKEGRARLVSDKTLAHAGNGALQLTSPANDDNSSGAGASGWLDNAGHERVYLRYYLKFAADYDQGNLNHTGGSLIGVSGDNKWEAMGSAGILPKGDDHFSTAFETWRDWGRVAAPGSMHLYTYWMDMKIDRDGNYWGNMLQPIEAQRFVPERNRWYCFEFMIRANEIDHANGELAAWVDGKLYAHFNGIRWRSDAAVKLKRFGLDVYVHHAAKDNTVWYDDVVVSTGYIGPTK